MRLLITLFAALPLVAQDSERSKIISPPHAITVTPELDVRQPLSKEAQEFLKKGGEDEIEKEGDTWVMEFANGERMRLFDEASDRRPCSIPLLRLAPEIAGRMDPNFHPPRATPYMPNAEPPAPPCENWPGVDRGPIILRRQSR